MNKKKRMMLATLPAIALLVLGSSVAYAHSGRMADLTEEQRSALEEARELRKDGEGEAARDVLKEAGLNPGFHLRGHGKHHTAEERAAFRARHEAVRFAIEGNDFEAFKNAIAEAPFAALVTEEVFAKLHEAQLLRKAGDRDGAHEVLKELGFPEGGHPMHTGAGEK